jgi:hypothetical protein
VDYLKEDDLASTRPVPTPAEVPVAEVDPLLRELTTEDRNVRRRVVSALLRGVLLDGGRGT